MPTGLLDGVREHCAAIAARARWIEIDASRAPSGVVPAGLDPTVHFLEGAAEDVARFILIVDAVNFGSGWFAELATSYEAITGTLAGHARRRGAPWSPSELRGLGPRAVSATLGHDPGHQLMQLYATALNQLGRWLGDGGALDRVADAGRSAERLAAALAAGMPFFDDRGFYKRAQITANDLALAGICAFGDLDRLTAFADNLIPHVLRVDGVLSYAPELAARIDAGDVFEPGEPMEVELRACAVHACELLAAAAGVPARVLDTWLWTRGRRPPYSDGRAHRARTVFY